MLFAAGAAEATLEVADGSGTSAFVTALVAEYPSLSKLLPRCALAVNGDYAEGELELHNGDEVAVLPPMSGG